MSSWVETALANAFVEDLKSLGVTVFTRFKITADRRSGLFSHPDTVSFVASHPFLQSHIVRGNGNVDARRRDQPMVWHDEVVSPEGITFLFVTCLFPQNSARPWCLSHRVLAKAPTGTTNEQLEEMAHRLGEAALKKWNKD